MSALVAWLAGKAGLWLAGAVAALAAGMGLYVKGRADSTARARLKSLENDNETAADLRRTVDRDLAGRVRNFDDAGFRD